MYHFAKLSLKLATEISTSTATSETPTSDHHELKQPFFHV